MNTALSLRNVELSTPQEAQAAAVAGVLQTIEALTAIRTFIQREFTDGVDAGLIPGCGNKKTLLNPGAQKAVMYFNAYPTYKIKEKDLGNGHVDFRVRCILIHRGTREQIGEGIGCASTKEKKFKRGGGGSAKACPKCKAATIIRSKYKEEWYCNAKAGGCGTGFPIDDKRITGAPEVEAVDESAYDMRNTALKIGKKRAFVDSAMTLGCLNELFTQDLEDLGTYNLDATAAVVEPQDEPEHHEPPPVANNASGHGRGSYASGAQTNEYEAAVAKFTEEFNGRFIDRWVEPGGEVVHGIREPLRTFQVTGHLCKWAVQMGMLDQSIIPEDAKPAQKPKYVAIVYHRSPEDRAALRAELKRYAGEQATVEEKRWRRANPGLAPECKGYEALIDAEQAEAMDAAIGDTEDDAFDEGRE